MSAIERGRDVVLADYPEDEARGISRRSLLLRGGSLIVAFSFVGGLIDTVAAQAGVAAVPYPTVNYKLLDSWLEIAADGTVTATTSRVDLGQGNRTALSQIIAEELYVPFERISLLMGDTMTSADQGITAGSSTIRSAGPQLRQIAADARLALLNLAPAHFQTPVSLLSTTNGVVQAPTGTIAYADLVAGTGFGTALPTTGSASAFTVVGPATPKSPLDYTIVGQEIPRSDIPGKVTGRWTFVHDVRLPGMVHARIVRPKRMGSNLITVGTPIAGTQVVRINNLLAVVADNEWDAIRGAAALQTTWTEWKGLPDTEGVEAFIKASISAPAKPFSQVGNADAAIAAAPTKLVGEYYTPIETHGSIVPRAPSPTSATGRRPCTRAPRARSSCRARCRRHCSCRSRASG